MIFQKSFMLIGVLSGDENVYTIYHGGIRRLTVEAFADIHVGL